MTEQSELKGVPSVVEAEPDVKILRGGMVVSQPQEHGVPKVTVTLAPTTSEGTEDGMLFQKPKGLAAADDGELLILPGGILHRGTDNISRAPLVEVTLAPAKSDARVMFINPAASEQTQQMTAVQPVKTTPENARGTIPLLPGQERLPNGRVRTTFNERGDPQGQDYQPGRSRRSSRRRI